MMFSMSTPRASARAGADASNAPYQRVSKLKSLAILVTAAFACGTAAHAADLPGTTRGNAYAAYANVKAGPVAASLANSAFVRCACQGTNGQVVSKEIDGLTAGFNGNVVSAGKTVASVYTAKTATTANMQNASSISTLVALGGLITSDSMNAVANVSADQRTMTASSNGSQFQNLVIAGQHIPDTVAPNTTLPLPGVGNVVLNKITTAGNMRSAASILVEMVSVNVTVRNNTLALPIGTKIVLGHAYAQYFRKVLPAVYYGSCLCGAGQRQHQQHAPGCDRNVVES